jgi:hypothetical protein
MRWITLVLIFMTSNLYADFELKGRGIDYDTFKILPKEDQRRVIQMAQTFVTQMEHQHAHKTNARYSYLKTLSDFLMLEAHAQSADYQKTCYYAGWVSYFNGSRCVHPRDLKLESVANVVKPHLQTYNTATDQWLENHHDQKDKCEQTGEILCNPALFGRHPQSGKAFCVRGNHNSVNSSYQCMAAVEGEVRLLKSNRASDNQWPDENPSADEWKNKILDGIIENALSTPEGKQHLQFTLLGMFDVCMCKNAGKSINQKYTDWMFNHRTCYGLIMQTQNVLDRMHKLAEEDKNVCRSIEGIKYKGNSMMDMLDFSSRASQHITDQFGEFKENKFLFEVSQGNKALHGREKHKFTELTSKMDGNRISAIADLKAAGICPVSYKPSLVLIGKDIEDRADLYEVTAIVWSPLGKKYKVNWVENENTNKQINEVVVHMNKIGVEYDVKAYIVHEGEKIYAKTIVPIKTVRTEKCAFDDTVKNDDGSYVVTVKKPTQDSEEPKVKWTINGEKSEQSARMITLPPLLLESEESNRTVATENEDAGGPILDQVDDVEIETDQGGIVVDHGDGKTDSAESYAIEAEYVLDEVKYYCETSISEKKKDIEEPEVEDGDECEVVTEEKSVEEGIYTYSFNLKEEVEAEVAWTIKIDDNDVTELNGDEVTLTEGQKAVLTALYKADDDKDISCTGSLDTTGEPDPELGDLDIDSKQILTTRLSEKFEAWAIEDSKRNDELGIIWCVQDESEEEEEEEKAGGDITDEVIEPTNEEGTTAGADCSHQGQKFKVSRTSVTQIAWAYLKDDPSKVSAEYTIEPKGAEGTNKRFRFNGKPGPNPLQMLDNRPRRNTGVR